MSDWKVASDRSIAVNKQKRVNIRTPFTKTEFEMVLIELKR